MLQSVAGGECVEVVQGPVLFVFVPMWRDGDISNVYSWGILTRCKCGGDM